MAKIKQIKSRPAQAVCLIEELVPSSHYSITELCEYVGITRQAYYNILSMASLPRVDVAIKISDYFISKGFRHCLVNDLWILADPKENAGSNPDQLPLDL